MKRTIIEKLLIALAAVAAIAVTIFFTIEDEPPVPHSVPAPATIDDLDEAGFIAYMPGLDDPEFGTIDDLNLKTEDRVLVLHVNEMVYGFPLLHMSGAGEHVVNCSLDGSAISVVHCNEAGVSRVFTGDADTPRLDLSQAGLFRNELRLVLSGEEYQMTDKSIPLEDVQFTEITWSEFKSEYPGGMVYKWPAWD